MRSNVGKAYGVVKYLRTRHHRARGTVSPGLHRHLSAVEQLLTIIGKRARQSSGGCRVVVVRFLPASTALDIRTVDERSRYFFLYLPRPILDSFADVRLSRRFLESVLMTGNSRQLTYGSSVVLYGVFRSGRAGTQMNGWMGQSIYQSVRKGTGNTRYRLIYVLRNSYFAHTARHKEDAFCYNA